MAPGRDRQPGRCRLPRHVVVEASLGGRVLALGCRCPAIPPPPARGARRSGRPARQRHRRLGLAHACRARRRRRSPGNAADPGRRRVCALGRPRLRFRPGGVAGARHQWQPLRSRYLQRSRAAAARHPVRPGAGAPRPQPDGAADRWRDHQIQFAGTEAAGTRGGRTRTDRGGVRDAAAGRAQTALRLPTRPAPAAGAGAGRGRPVGAARRRRHPRQSRVARRGARRQSRRVYSLQAAP